MTRRTLGLLRADAAGLVVLVLLGLTVVLEIVEVLSDSASAIAAVLLVPAGVVSLGAQGVHSLRAFRRLRERVWRVSLCVQAIAFAGPAIVFGFADWGGMLGYLLGSCALLLPARFALGIVAAAELVLVVLEPAVAGTGAADTAYIVLETALIPLLVWSLSGLADGVVELEASRRRTAELAVTRERHRLTEDLDALLGGRLQAIRDDTTSVADAIGAESSRVDAATHDAIMSIVDLSRGALHDVRSVAAGDRGISMSAQLAFARSILGAAGVEFEARLPSVTISTVSDALLAEVIREGVTSTVRRAATHCRLSLAVDGGIARLVMDDGAPTDPTRSTEQFAALDSRLRAVGGRLQRPANDRGETMLVATMPAYLT